MDRWSLEEKKGKRGREYRLKGERGTAIVKKKTRERCGPREKCGLRKLPRKRCS